MAQNEQSPLVTAVLALDSYFSELERLGKKINSLEMKSEFDFEHAEKLMARFAVCGQGVATEVVNLSNSLNESRAQAESIAQLVSTRAEQISQRKSLQQQQMEQLRILAEKVGALSETLNTLRRPEGEKLTEQDKVGLAHKLGEFEGQLEPLITEAKNLRQEAQRTRTKILEQNAESLTQTLQAVRQKLQSIPGTLLSQ